MEVVKERIEPNGSLHIPDHILEALSLKVGEEVELRLERAGLLMVPGGRKRLPLARHIVDALVEQEEMFGPEVT